MNTINEITVALSDLFFEIVGDAGFISLCATMALLAIPVAIAFGFFL